METYVGFNFAFLLKVLAVCLLGVSVGDVEVKSEGSRKHKFKGAG